jgi:hypothetical protein
MLCVDVKREMLSPPVEPAPCGVGSMFLVLEYQAKKSLTLIAFNTQ